MTKTKPTASSILEHIAAVCLLGGVVLTVVNLVTGNLLWPGLCCFAGFLICTVAMNICRKREWNQPKNPYQKRYK